MQPLLIFHNRLYDSDSLINGRLVLIDKSIDEIQEVYIASSGMPGHQTFDDLNLVAHGSIPPFFKPYLVKTSPLYESETVGIEGNFYPITPNTVVFDEQERGDFGVHFDANVPGSSGCIVLETSVGWNAFQSRMKQLLDNGHKSIPLLVSYSR